MPTCDSKTKPTSLGSLSAAELDQNGSEAAKVKRTKDQAYFNSYDFDAIEVLPYEEDEAVDHTHSLQNQHQHHHHHGSHSGHHIKYTAGGCKTCHQISTSHSASVSPDVTPTTVSHSHSLYNRPHHHQQLQQQLKKKKISSSHSSSHSSSSNSSLRLGSFSRPNSVGDTKRTYLKRIGAFFTSHSIRKQSSMESLADIEKQAQQANSSTSSSQISLDHMRSAGSGSAASGGAIIKRDLVIDDAVNSNFLLPRAMLKYQSVGFGNSMPLAVISNLSGSLASTRSDSINSQLNQVTSNSTSTTSTSNSKSQPSTVESSISATDPVHIINSNLKKPPNHIGGIKSKSENSGFISSSSSSSSPSSASASVSTLASASASASASSACVSASVSSTSLAKSTLIVRSSLCGEPSIIGEKSANVDVNRAPGSATAAPVASKSIANPNVVSSISSDFQPSYNKKLPSSSLSSSMSALGAAAVVNSGGAPSSSSSTATATTGNAVVAPGHSNSGRGARDRTSSQSHYSTDKSGSSGYYSSHVCSTYSVEDHIYCEPVVDILEVGKSATLASSKLVQSGSSTGPRKIMIVQNSDDDDEDHHNHHNLHDHQRDQNMQQNLRILETSIENLDRHLKNYPKQNSQDRIASFVRSNSQANVAGGVYEILKNRYGNLPTIMESTGTHDGQANLQKTWQEEIAEDSLLDIDLDSFLLVSERKSRISTGIDNPTFDNTRVLHDEDMENHYKCAKYINSCPEDAYRLESEVGTNLDHFLKKYEDQIHFQNTRELLEDVRDKIRLLSESSENSPNNHAANVNKNLPQELETMIKALKSELESYLERMNHHSEMEIRQLCAGLVKNQNIVKMKKAFERRKSNASEPEYDFAYEAIRDGGTIVTVQHTRQHIEMTSVRCTSDPNFKMKRKSLSEVFPTMNAECYSRDTSAVVAIDGSSGNCCSSRDISGIIDKSGSLGDGGQTSITTRTQLQRNLSFHKPILNKLGGGETNGDGDKDSILDWHRKKPSIWEMYYGTNRMNQTLLGKRGVITNGNQAIMSYPSSRPESDFTLDLPRAEQLRIKMEKEKKFRRRCRYLTTFLSLVFFLLTVMVVSLVLTRGKRMFGSMI